MLWERSPLAGYLLSMSFSISSFIPLAFFVADSIFSDSDSDLWASLG